MFRVWGRPWFIALVRLSRPFWIKNWENPRGCVCFFLDQVQTRPLVLCWLLVGPAPSSGLFHRLLGLFLEFFGRLIDLFPRLLGRAVLIQRVGYGLSQILVVSTAGGNILAGAPHQQAQYYDHLLSESFGSYRALLGKVTYSTEMGLYLSHLKNRKADPSIGRYPAIWH